MVKIERNQTRPVRIGSVTIGDNNPIAVQSMTATKTQDVEATVALVKLMQDAGADVVRIAVDSKKDAEALAEICLLYTSPSPRDLSTSRMPSSA